MGYQSIKYQSEEKNNMFKAAVTSFICDRCENLLYDYKKAEESCENVDNCTGSSNGQKIPYNMQMDINRLCLENAIKRFMNSGKKADAFDVYFCYLEIFVGDYKTSRRMIELLSEYEENGSKLLMKHRDHYSHSVYVFLLGLAFYESNSKFRDVYANYYALNSDKAAEHFLRYWGMTSLFHDVGYPFELPFEQVESYFEVAKEERHGNPFLSYNNLDKLTIINNEIKEILKSELGFEFQNTDLLFSYILAKKLSSVYGFTEGEMNSVLSTKPTKPNNFSYFMDHAYFSANILFKKFLNESTVILEQSFDIKPLLDSFTAILMHNSLYKFSIAKYHSEGNKPFKMELHPLAYLLMLSDELQCWDRTAYGRNSKIQIHPMDCEFAFSDNKLHVTYIFDKVFESKIKEYENKCNKVLETGNSNVEMPKLKAYSDFATDSVKKDIESIVDLSFIDFEVSTELRENDHKKNSYLSSSSFLNLYKFAVVLNGRYCCIGENGEWQKVKEGKISFEEFLKGKETSFENMFNALSLEYKLSNINQAKSFDRYLNSIGCFYSDKEFDMEMIEKFSIDESLKIGPMEHQRWLQEHYEMGWTYGEEGKDYTSKSERENRRVHKDMIKDFTYTGVPISYSQAVENYNRLGKEEQEKDTDPMDCMLALLKLYDGLRVYKLCFDEINN